MRSVGIEDQVPTVPGEPSCCTVGTGNGLRVADRRAAEVQPRNDPLILRGQLIGFCVCQRPAAPLLDLRDEGLEVLYGLAVVAVIGVFENLDCRLKWGDQVLVMPTQ